MSDWIGERPDTVDLLLALGLSTVGLLAAHQWQVAGEPDAAWLRDLLVVLLCLPLARRRREPRLVLAVVTAVAAAIWILGFADGPTVVAGSIAVYGAGRYVERPESIRAFAVAGGLLAVVAGWLSATGGEHTWFEFAARCGVVVAAFAIGDAQRSRAALVDHLRAQAERAERLRVLEVQRAASDERARIARELHDVVAHSVSVMVVQATAAERTVSNDPHAATASMASVADVGRQALVEMRRILQVLDTEGAATDFAPQPTLADLDPIIDRYRAAGLDVEVAWDGAAVGLDPGTELVIVRIVQESLTNVLRHATCARARVRLDIGEVITIEVADDGAAHDGDGERRPGAPAADAGGRGLIGMRERAEALGGTVTARPGADGGFVVRAVLPVEQTTPARRPAALEGTT